MQKSKYWHKLDNAAKVFPAISRSGRSNVFRLAFYLKNDVNKDVLSEAVNKALNRIEVFKVQLKNGLFWNYFSENKNYYIVEKEPSSVCKYFRFSNNKGFLFKVYYLNNKISLETFHALSDGTGAMEFLKSIVYEYLILMGESIDHDNLILSRKAFSNKENIDAFNNNYDPKKKKKLKEDKAYHLKGEHFKDDFSLVFKIQTNLEDFIKLVKEKYQSTITEYLTTVMAYSIYEEAIDFENNKKPIKMFVPVNLRPYFEEITLRNFSLYIKSTFESKRKWTFNEMLAVVKSDFNEQLAKDKLNERLNALVGLEKKMIVRFIPLFIKNIVFKFGYQMLGESVNTSSLSNLGKLVLPNEMKEHVIDSEFINVGHGINTAVLSYNNNLNIVITTSIKDISVIKSYVNILKNDGLKMVIDTNYLEEYDETL